ncbi:MAG TPA: tannase/feruloyl esterase family alpha/beta hydrolase, partial [Burkholderiaceae bacterium]|nr:tannase/feruloyl esterase family alpha/beta hydrolase [Burkholderiaceae bacterium]
VPGAVIASGPYAGLPDLSGAWTAAERQLVSNAVLARCDALDGAVDGLVQDFQACQRRFDLDVDVPTCAGPRDGTCLTAAQKAALSRNFAGPTTPDGRPIYARFPFDSGHGSVNTVFWEFIAPILLDPGAVGFVFKTPPADPTTFIPPQFTLTADIQQLARQIYATDATYTQSGMAFMTPPEPERLEEFRRRGDRMIVYQGVSDPIFSILDTIRWYRHLGARDGEHDSDDGAADSARLFAVPGMNHCSGGPATDQFDLLTPLIRWVETGRAPERVVATARGTGNAGGANAEVPPSWSPSRTRPLCAYPRAATYVGGPIESEHSFACR